MTQNGTLLQKAKDLAMGYRKSAALFAAIDLGLFGMLGGDPLPLDEIAAGLGVPPRRLRALLDLLAFHGLLEKNPNGYAISATWLPLTDPRREDNLQSRYAHQVRLSRSWFLAGDVIRNDTRAANLPSMEKRDHKSIEAFHRSLGVRGLMEVRALVSEIQVPDAPRILDIGGGAGDLCRPFLERFPGSTAVLFETPDTAEFARRRIRDSGLEKRFEILSGDFLTDELPYGFDLIILSNILHIYSESTAIELLTRLEKTAKPGGRLFIREIKIDDLRSGPESGVEFALNMAINTDEGDAYPLNRVMRWLSQTGWGKGREIGIDQETHYGIVAVKDT